MMAEYRDKHLPWVREFLARHDPWYRFRWEMYFDQLAGLLGNAESFLDAGCGENETIREISFNGLKLGVDLTIPEKAEHFCCTHLERLPFASASFEVIGCRFVLEHLKRPREVLQEFNRVLRPGGYLLTQTTNCRHPLIALSRLLPRFLKQKLMRRIYGRAGGSAHRTYHRFNRPRDFRQIQAGLVPVRVWFVEDLHLESKTAFFVSYLFHALTRWVRCNKWRSSITVLWQKSVEPPGGDAL